MSGCIIIYEANILEFIDSYFSRLKNDTRDILEYWLRLARRPYAFYLIFRNVSVHVLHRLIDLLLLKFL